MRKTNRPLKTKDFQALAAFRAALREFAHFSEDAAREAGLTPQQHQALVAIRGHAGPELPSIGDIATALRVKHHSAVGLIDRIEQRGLVTRGHSTTDNRKVLVWVTPAGEEMLRSLTKAHREEHKRLAEILAILNDHPDID